MGWFKKKKQKVEIDDSPPKLLELPRLPELPGFEKEKLSGAERSIHQLPSFPNNSLGEKFSQNTIKEAITGEKEDKRGFEEEDFMPKEIKISPKPLKKSISKEVPTEFKEAARRVKSIEPIFIRIDKFEESLKTFEKAKEKISEIEKVLKDIKRIKEEEEKELESWEKELQIMKAQIEKVDKDIFSKIE